MRRNCNLNLCLLPPAKDSGDDNSEEGSSRSTSSPQQPQQQPQQLTIFYNGRICVCDVTELQARAIIWQARQEADERMGSPNSVLLGSPSNLPSQLIHSPSTPTTTTASSGVSMKMSLQRFLQKRKNRIYATHPYKK